MNENLSLGDMNTLTGDEVTKPNGQLLAIGNEILGINGVPYTCKQLIVVRSVEGVKKQATTNSASLQHELIIKIDSRLGSRLRSRLRLGLRLGSRLGLRLRSRLGLRLG